MEELCFCRSGLPYECCCKGKLKPGDKPGLLKKISAERIQYIKENPKVCLFPNCEKAGIYSHSISQKAVLDRIAVDGHVYMPIVQVGKQNALVLRGIEKQTSGFHCFCLEHDKTFYPIDDENLGDTDSLRFLYAYRIFSSTYYKVLREKCWFDKITKKYDFSEEKLLRTTYEKIYRQLIALNSIKILFDSSIINSDYSRIISFSIRLDYRIGFSSATAFCPKYDLFGNTIEYTDNELELLYITTNPYLDYTIIIISCIDIDKNVYEKLFKQLDVTPVSFILKYLNNLFPYYCENIAISPILKEKWNEEGIKEFLSVINLNPIERQIIPSSYFFKERKYNLFLKI